MAQDRSVTKSDIDRILAEARVTDVAQPTADVTLVAADFCVIYKSRVRPIVMVIIGFLKVINKAWAEAVAAVVAIVDKLCP